MTPQFHFAVASRGEEFAIWTERQRVDGVAMRRSLAAALLNLRVVEACDQSRRWHVINKNLIPPAACRVLPVARQCHRINHIEACGHWLPCDGRAGSHF